MSSGSVSGSYQVAAVCWPAVPRRERDRLDRLHRDAALGAHARERLEVGGVERVLQLDGSCTGSEHRVEREALEAAQVHRGDRQPVPGDADEADETLVARLDRRLERAALAQRGLPLDHVDEVVQLDQVDAVDAEPLERAPDLLLRSRVLALAGLRREEELVAVAREPRCEAQLRVAVRRGGVDVVDAVLEEQLERRGRLRPA